jgi:hypothetical protein
MAVPADQESEVARAPGLEEVQGRELGKGLELDLALELALELGLELGLDLELALALALALALGLDLERDLDQVADSWWARARVSAAVMEPEAPLASHSWKKQTFKVC